MKQAAVTAPGYDALAYLAEARRRRQWLFRIRPNVLAGPLYKLLTPYERRVVVPVEGIHFLCDPLSFTAGQILETGTYERSTIEMLGRYLRPGGVFVDIGANEGFIASCAAKIIGPQGTLIAVEPQSEIFRVLQANLCMNGSGPTFTFRNALSKTDGEPLTINLSPYVNTGTSSIVRRTWLSRTEMVSTISFGRLMQVAAVNRVQLVKVDVEGFEKEVVDSIVQSGVSEMVDALAIDYHASILQSRGIDPRQIENQLLAVGFKPVESESAFNGYTVYRR